jgi:hypothetical protein
MPNSRYYYYPVRSTTTSLRLYARIASHCLSRNESRRAYEASLPGELTNYSVVHTSLEPLQDRLLSPMIILLNAMGHFEENMQVAPYVKTRITFDVDGTHMKRKACEPQVA